MDTRYSQCCRVSRYFFLVIDLTYSSLSYDPSLGSSLWQPNVTIFDRPDAEISILFLAANNVRYFEQVHDPWFSVGAFEESTIITLSDGSRVPIYTPTREVTIVGCIERHQICTSSEAGNQRCTALSSLTDTNVQVDDLGLNSQQRAAATRILFNVLGIDLAFVAAQLQGDALVASRTVLEGMQQESLPSTQWRDEISRWFSIALILLQDGVVQYVTGPSRPEWVQYVSRNTNPEELADCASQRLRMSSSQQNFSLTGIIVVLVLGTLIIAIGLSIDTIAYWFRKRLPKGDQRSDEWVLDSVFQHQRLAYQGIGVKDWEEIDCFIPVSKQNFPNRKWASHAMVQNETVILLSDEPGSKA